MFLFYRLLFAHLCADLAFQTKELFYWKKKSAAGSCVHGIIFIVISAFFCISYLISIEFVLFIILMASARVLIDIINTWITKSQRFDNIFTYLGYHLARIALLLPVMFMPSLNRPRLLEGKAIASIYNNDAAVIYLSFFVAVVYGGSFIIYYMKRSFSDPGAVFQFDYLGMMERLIVFSSCLISGLWLLLAPVVISVKWLILLFGIKFGLLRIDSPALQFQKIRIKSNAGMDLIVSPLYAIIMAVILKGF